MGNLVLGTVQLGMPYGVANKTGKPNQKMATEIVRAAWEGGVREFDTAQEYGESERVLGVAFRELGIADQVKVVSKLAKNVDIKDGEVVKRAVEESLARLGVSKLHGLLMHKEELLDEWRSSRTVLFQQRTVLEGMVEHIGVSVYSPERALQAIDTDGIDIVQIPSNILDRRFERAGVFERAKARGMEVYVRSVFLQGLLLMDTKNLPAHMEFAKSMLEGVDKLAHELGVSRQVLALQYVKTAFPQAQVIIGAETPKQVHENVAAWNIEAPVGIVERVRQEFEDVDEKILDPRKWPKA